ncbi:MAG: hypothetical protein HN978_05710 [Desulfobacula sp.]|jgi:hypothetical protein|nr:hypothetical protein [Desulfobacula sp.]MBT7049155.1 hypothetical protein [Desulfobacula sp.]
MDIATNSKIPFADRQKLGHSSLKHFGDLKALVIKNLYAKLHNVPVRQSAYPLAGIANFEF